MAHWIIKTKPGCNYCTKAKDLLSAEGIVYEEQKHETDAELAGFVASGFRTFPQIFRDGCHIGGHAELMQHFAEHADF